MNLYVYREKEYVLTWTWILLQVFNIAKKIAIHDKPRYVKEINSFSYHQHIHVILWQITERIFITQQNGNERKTARNCFNHLFHCRKLRRKRWKTNAPLGLKEMTTRKITQKPNHSRNESSLHLIFFETFEIQNIDFHTESIKTTYMENVSTGVLEKIENNI